jgi:hypothetical protein
MNQEINEPKSKRQFPKIYVLCLPRPWCIDALRIQRNTQTTKNQQLKIQARQNLLAEKCLKHTLISEFSDFFSHASLQSPIKAN